MKFKCGGASVLSLDAMLVDARMLDAPDDPETLNPRWCSWTLKSLPPACQLFFS